MSDTQEVLSVLADAIDHALATDSDTVRIPVDVAVEIESMLGDAANEWEMDSE
jgi:hypothetical protein